MFIGFQRNIQDGGDFAIYVETYHNGESKNYNSTEGLAILFDEELNKMETVGAMSTENLERAMTHLFRAIMNGYKEAGLSPLKFRLTMASILDKLDNLIDEEIDKNGTGSLGDFGKNRN